MSARRTWPLAVLIFALLATVPEGSAAATAGKPPRVKVRPVVSGAPVVGATLRASSGRWAGRPSRRAFAWLRCDGRGRRCVAVKPARSRRYRVQARDVGHRLRAKVTATKRVRLRGGRRRTLRAAARSAPTAIVRARPAAGEPGGGSPATPAPAGPPGTGGAGPSPSPSPSPSFSGLHVVGNRLVDADGDAVQLHGVNKAGTEYACVQGWGFFDGASDAASVAAMEPWNINSVRLPLNENCWLGINGVDPQYSGANYRQAIRQFVDRLLARGIVVELSLMWASPGSESATYQPEAPNADHSPAMWASMASEYKDVPNVILAPWGEPTVGADCLLEGGCEATFGSGVSYEVAGMQEAVDVMRAAGYEGPIAIPGLEYANDLRQWLSHKPVDPLGQLVAEAHLYGKNRCDTVACLDAEYAPVAAQVPLILGETGETYDADSCGSTYIRRFLEWADAHGVGYQAWTWNTWGTCLALIDDDDGTARNTAYAAAVKQHFGTRLK